MAVAIASAFTPATARRAHARSAAPVLRSVIENVTQATAYRYFARDNEGTSLDGLKVLRNPKGGYLGVYHSLQQGVFTVKLAHSANLLTWVRVANLDINADDGAALEQNVKEILKLDPGLVAKLKEILK